MGCTVNVNGLSLVHKGSNGVSMATIPDICKTPSPGGPIPIPYPNIAMSSDLADGTTTVKVDGGNSAAVKGCNFKMSTGDEAGSAGGGVKSSKFKGKSEFILASFDVKLDGKDACRLSDKKTHNEANTVNLAGIVNPPIPPAQLEAICNDLEATLEATMEEELPPSRTEGATVAMGQTVPAGGGAGTMVGGASSVSANVVKRGGKYAHWASGIEQGDPSNVQTCDDPPQQYQHRQGGRPKEGHAEAKIIEDFFKPPNNGQGQLVLKIGGKKDSPCPDCARLIKEVNEGKGGNGKCNVIKVCE